MTDTEKALLGNREAAKRLTDAGMLLPCPWCSNTPTEDDLIGHWQGYTIYHQCKQVGPMRVNAKTRYKVCLAWNTRAPILSAEEMEMLDERSV